MKSILRCCLENYFPFKIHDDVIMWKHFHTDNIHKNQAKTVRFLHENVIKSSTICLSLSICVLSVYGLRYIFGAGNFWPYCVLCDENDIVKWKMENMKIHLYHNRIQFMRNKCVCASAMSHHKISLFGCLFVGHYWNAYGAWSFMYLPELWAQRIKYYISNFNLVINYTFMIDHYSRSRRIYLKKRITELSYL